MSKMHLFISEDTFNSKQEFDQFILPTYDDDGEFIESGFMTEVEFDEYEPMCIERIYTDDAVKVTELLKGASYYEQWLHKISINDFIKSAVAVFEPNTLINPQKSSMKYVGSFEYAE